MHMIRSPHIKLVILTTILMVNCQDGYRTVEKLASVDSLLCHDEVDTATICFDEISTNNVESKEDLAYYYLIQAEINYRNSIPAKSDSSINYCVSYYEMKKDNEKLARAYFYKGVTTFNPDSISNTILLLKQAEELAEKTDNQRLQHKICEKLSYYNNDAFEFQLGKHYAQKALVLARKLKDQERQAVALLYLTANYLDTGNKDSALICANECVTVINPKDERLTPYLYTHLGRIYEREDPQLSKLYLKKALAIKGIPNTYKTLANIYLREDSVQKANEMWEQALDRTRNSKMNTISIEIFNTMRQQCVEREDYKQANALADSAMAWQKRYYQTQEQERLAEIQAKYDKNLAEQQLWHKIYGWGMLSIVVVGLVIAWLGYNSYRGLKVKKALAETKAQLAAYTLKAEELEAGKDVNVKEVARLHQKISELQQRQAGILANGKQLWEALQSGATAFNWNKGDFTDFVEYYKLKDLPFVNELETDYERLSVKYMTFAILEHEGRSDADIQRIMGISESTLRSTRSRINKAKRT